MIYEHGEPLWNDIDRGKQKNSEKNLSQCHFVYNISIQSDPGANPSQCGERPATNRLSHSTAWKIDFLIFKYSALTSKKT
jgi:hypothetical protein